MNETRTETGVPATVAATSTRVLLGLLGWQGQILASSDLPSRPGRSQRLADLCAVSGARAYVCGTGGMTYLDQAPFAAEGVAVMLFQPPTTNIWSFGRRLSALWALAALGPQDVAACLQRLASDYRLLAAAAGRRAHVDKTRTTRAGTTQKAPAASCGGLRRIAR